MKKICVIGSLNIDIIGTTDTLPRLGETVRSNSFDMLFGGKGANQAVALGKLGADVRMAGLLGERSFGMDYPGALAQNGVNKDMLEVVCGETSGIAYIAVDGAGNNMLFAYPGANAKVTPAYIDECWERIAECDIFLLQQEIPVQTNLHVMRRLAGLSGKLVILDPAPAVGTPEECLRYADIITPNETELEAISGVCPDSAQAYREACAKLHARGAKTVVAKAGKHGAYVSKGDAFDFYAAFPVDAVDATAAGDTFNAGLAFGLANGLDISTGVVIGHAAAGLSVTGLGAQSAMPDFAAVKAFLRERSPETAKLLEDI